MGLRLLSYNIHGGIGSDGVRDLKRIHRFIQSQLIDIAFLQEVETRQKRGGTGEELRQLQGEIFPHIVTGEAIVQEDGWYGNILMSRYPISQATLYDLSVELDLEPRNALDIVVDTNDGPLRVIGTHLGLAVGERKAQANKLAYALQIQPDIPAVLTGDINEWRWCSPLFRVFDSYMERKPCGRTFPSWWPLFHLDRLWCRPGTLVRSIRPIRTSETRKFSDHLPLLAEIEL